MTTKAEAAAGAFQKELEDSGFVLPHDVTYQVRVAEPSDTLVVVAKSPDNLSTLHSREASEKLEEIPHTFVHDGVEYDIDVGWSE